MKTIITLLLLFLAHISPLEAQVTLKGVIKSLDGEALPFVNIALYSSADTTKFLLGSVSDMKGMYSLPAMSTGEYHIVVSTVGFKTNVGNVRLRMPSVGNVITRDFFLEEDTQSLKEVVISGSRKTNYADKSVYTFSKEQIANARQTGDLLKNVEDLTIDSRNNKIKKIDGSLVQILINGVNATDNDLKMIPADKVLKVEYYNIPPARYAAASTLVNVITKRLNTGWNGGVEIDHAFTTGFGNDDFYLKRVIGNHQLSLDYSLRYRDYSNRSVVEEYRYKLDGSEYAHLYDSNDKFGYTTHDINLKYSYSKLDSHTFQVVFSPDFETNFADAKSNIKSQKGQEYQNESGMENNHIRTFNPSMDLYFSKNFSKNQELVVDLTGTYYSNRQTRKKNETMNEEDLLSDNMYLKNHKESLIGEISYTKKQGFETISLGYKVTLASSRSMIENYFSAGGEYNYHSGNDNHYLYAEYGNSWKKIMYRIGLGETYVRTYNDDTKFSKWLFTPKIVLACNISSKQNIQFQMTSTPVIPTISQLNDNATFVTRELLRRGNPYLRSSIQNMANLIYGLNFSWLNIRIGGIYSYESKPISTFYKIEKINDKQYVVSTSENGKSFVQYGGLYLLNIKPFKSEILTLKFYGTVMEQRINSALTGNYKHLYAPFFYSIDARKGIWGASFQGNIVSRQIEGSSLRQDENLSNLQVFCQYKKMRFMASCYWLMTISKYHYETLPNSILRNSCDTKIKDNKSMFTVGFSWNFSTGSRHYVDRKIHHKDIDKGTF